MRGRYSMNLPDYSRLDDIFAVFVHILQHLSGLRLHLGLDGLIKVDAYFLRFEVCVPE
jgi:hypothetical protein